MPPPPPSTPEQDLLALAWQAVRRCEERADDPADDAGRILAAWCTSGITTHACDADFIPTPRPGVEALAFVVAPPTPEGRLRGGLVLRLSGQHPDSYEEVEIDQPGPAQALAAIRASLDRP